MKILVIQLRRIGDILLTTPVVSYLKTLFPDARVDFLCEPCGKAVLETNSKINRVIIYDKAHPLRMIKEIRTGEYNVVLDFMNNPRTSLLTALSRAKWKVGVKRFFRSIAYNVRVIPGGKILYVPLWKLEIVKFWLNAAGIPPLEPKQILPELYLDKNDMAFAENWERKENLKRPFVVLIPTHRHPIRRWRWEGFRELGLRLCEKENVDVYLAWGPGEEELINQIRKGHEKELKILPNTTIRQSAAIFRKARLVVTNDSGLMHTAVAAGAPTVTIYGPTRPRDWNPSSAGVSTGRNIPVTAGDVACLGCHLANCPYGHLCMTHLSVDAVFRACQNILTGGDK